MFCLPVETTCYNIRGVIIPPRVSWQGIKVRDSEWREYTFVTYAFFAVGTGCCMGAACVLFSTLSVTVAGAKRSVSKLNLSKTYTYFDSIIIQCRCSKSTVTPYRTISGSYEWLRLGQGATDRQCLLRSPAAVAYRDRSLRIVALSRSMGEHRWQEPS